MAQTVDTTAFVRDRPGFSTPPDVLAFRRFQLEDGIQYTNSSRGDVRNENLLFSSLLVRYGILKFAELHLQTDFACIITTDSTGRSFASGLDPVTIGAKIRILRQRKVIPNISLMFNLTLPFIGKREFLPKTLTPSLLFLMSNDLTKNLNLCYNYGLTWYNGPAVIIHFYAVCLNIQLRPKWGIFVEGYGTSGLRASPTLNMDTGVAFLINDHLQADFSVSGSLTSMNDFYLLNMGIAWKIPGKNRIKHG